MSSVFASNFEACAPELFENLDEMLLVSGLKTMGCTDVIWKITRR